MDIVVDVLLPRTDLGVLIQVIVLALVFGVLLWRLWPRADLRLLIIGAGLFVFGLIGLRSLH